MYTCMVMEEKDLVKENNGPSKFYLKHLNDPAQDKLSPPDGQNVTKKLHLISSYEKKKKMI